MKNAILKFLRDEQGATAIEYGLIAGLIAAVIVAVVTALGTTLNTTLKGLCVALAGASTPPAACV